MKLIKNGTVIDPKSNTQQKMDILIEKNKIVQMGENLLDNMTEKPEKIVHADGLMVAPGLVDVHVHFRDPGFTYKEDIQTGARAAAAGGFTSVVLMANTKPVVDNLETLAYVLEKGAETEIHVYTCATVTQGMKGTALNDMKTLFHKGAVGFTDDGVPIMEESIVRLAMKQAAELGVPLSFHEENPAFITNNGINAGKAAEHFGIKGSPREAEIDMVRRDLELAIETGADINIQHISSKEAVELVREARKKSTHIHAEATPHHFSLTEEAAIRYGTLAKMNPPLRTEEDRQAIIEGLADGTIDLIATDHAPHSMEEKKKSITEAPSGIIGLETSLSLGITNLVQTGKLTLCKLIEKMSYNPAKLYHLNAGELRVGGPADMVIFADRETWEVKSFQSKSANSPFAGQKLQGKIIYTICDGEIVFDNR
ncbi:MAG: dihydroorotase [Lachnospiraceae bacterium]|nr:dihydroorotase [Lachnospiraceae bacterium]